MPGTDRPTLVVAAIPEELTPLLRRLRADPADRIDGRRVFRARWRGSALVLSVTGDGPANAAGAARLCEEHRPGALVGIGVAGALTSALAPLDLVASARVSNGTGSVPAPDGALLSRALAAGARSATLLTVAAPVVSRSARAAAAAAVSGEPHAAVDMESAAWARSAWASGVPFVVVRAISDGAEEELPGYLADCVGTGGGIRRSAVVARALARPSSIGSLLRMRRRVAECGRTLASFLLDRFFES